MKKKKNIGEVDGDEGYQKKTKTKKTKDMKMKMMTTTTTITVMIFERVGGFPTSPVGMRWVEELKRKL